jgi:hypothetical protein
MEANAISNAGFVVRVGWFSPGFRGLDFTAVAGLKILWPSTWRQLSASQPQAGGGAMPLCNWIPRSPRTSFCL